MAYYEYTPAKCTAIVQNKPIFGFNAVRHGQRVYGILWPKPQRLLVAKEPLSKPTEVS